MGSIWVGDSTLVRDILERGLCIWFLDRVNMGWLFVGAISGRTGAVFWATNGAGFWAVAGASGCWSVGV